MQLALLGITGSKNVEAISVAIRGLSLDEAAAALSTTALSAAQQQQILLNEGLCATIPEATTALAMQSAANVEETVTTEGATVATAKFGAALKGLWTTIISNPYLAAGAALLAVLGILKKVHDAQEQAKQDILDNAEAAQSSIESIKQSLDNASNVVEKSGKRFAELAQGVDALTGKNKSLSNDEYEEFLNISNQLAETFPELTRHYDENGNAIVGLSGDVDTITGSLYNLLDVQKQLANQEIADNLPDVFEGASTKSKEYDKQIKLYQGQIAETQKIYDELLDGTFLEDGVLHIKGGASNKYNYSDIEKDYLKVLNDLGYGYKLISKEDAYSDSEAAKKYPGYSSRGGVNLPTIGATYEIDFRGTSEEDAKKQIREGLQEYLKLYSDEIVGFNNQIKSIQNKDTANWSELTKSLTAWLETDSSYQMLSDDMRNMVQRAVSNVDFSGFKDWDEASKYIIDNIVTPLYDASPELEKAISSLFDIDFATATLSDYFNAIKPYLTAIATALGKTEEEIVEMFGLTDKITDFNALTAKRNELLKNFGGDHSESQKSAFGEWLDNLSAGDLEIVYKISTEYTSEKVKDQLEAYQDGGKVNLFLRPKVDNSELKKAGWDVSDDGYATVFTGTYSNTAGTIAANFTPILTDENGNFDRVLSPDEFTRYCEDVLDGVREDDLKLQIGATFDGENAIEEADKAAGEIHILQDYLYDLGDPSNFNLDKWAYALNQFKSAAAEPLSAFNELLNDKGTAKDPHFIDRVDKYVEKVNKLNSAYKKLSEGDFSNEDFDKLIRDFPTLATRADDLGLAINELKDAMNSEMDNDFADQFGKMNTDADVEALESYRQAILSVGKTVDLATSLFAGDSNKTQKIINNASKVQTLLNSQKGGQSISLESFNSEEFKDYKEALEYVNGAVQLNEEKVVEITKAKAKEQIAINKSNKAMSQAKYIENARQINVYRKCLADANNERDQLTYQTKIDSLVAENESIAEACKQYDFLSKTLQEATDSYQHWLNAQSASDYGDMMSDTEDAIKLISDTLDETSDIYGQVGSKKYQAALDLIVPDSVDRDSIAAVKQYMANLKKYFYFDEDGAIAGMDIQGFIQKSLEAGLMTFDSANQEYKIAGSKTMESFAEGLKLSSGMVQAFFDEMQLYGGKFDWSDEIGKSIDELYAGIEDLNALPHFKDITLKLDFSDISTAEGQIKAIDDEIQKVNKIKATPNIDSSELQYANDILVYLTEQKQQLTAPAIMSVDTTQVDEKYQEAIGLAQEYQNTLDTKELYAIKGLDTADLDKKLAETQQKIKGINPKIKAELNLDTTSKDGIETFIKNFDPNKYPKIVNFKANTDEVDNARKEVSKPVDVDVNYIPHDGNLPNIDTDVDVNVHYHKIVDGDTDVGDLNGTAHASGTAKVGGDWGTAKGGKTLVGELGREIVVDVRTGKWYTVGDRGAEFVDIPAGSIVFNHIQSQSLLENGYVSGRAHALASGTAMVTGGIGLPGVQASTARKNRIEAEIAKAAASELSDSTPDGGDNNVEDSFKYIDRVEILLDRIHRKIDAVKDAISDVFSLWSTRGDNITKQIGNITEEIDTQQAAARRYLEEARKQIDKYDLDPEWVKSLEEGNIGFIYLTNLDELHEGYEEYLKWYNKYLDSRDTIAGLERDLSQLYKDQFDNIKTNYEKQIDLNEYLRDSEEKTYTQSTSYFDDMRGVYSKNLELLTSEAKELEEQLQKAVDSDAVEVGSEAWQEMKKDINSVTKEIAKTNVELAKLYTEQFDYIQNNYQNQISSYESLNDANEKNFTATTNYYKEMREISHKTLKAQQDELADLEKEFNEAMASGRIEEGSEAWYKMRGAIDDTTRAIAKTRVELKQLYLDEFEYIQSGYKNQLSLYDHYASIYNKKSTLLETQGYMTSGKLLSYQKNLQERNIGTLKEELVSLETELNEAMDKGDIERYSDAWYSMTSSINAVKEAIYDARVEQEKLNKAMEQLEWDTFDLQQEMISQPKDENDYFISLLSNVDLYPKRKIDKNRLLTDADYAEELRKGQEVLTKAGYATLGLHSDNATIYATLRKEYTDAINELDKEHASDLNNAEYVKRRQELIKARRDTVLAIESEENAMISLAENGVKTELDALKQLIDVYKDAISSAKDLYDYQKSVAEKSKDVAKLQKQLSAYTNDSSEETKATVQKLKVDLSDAQKDLQETEYNRMVSEQQKLLDSVYDEYEAFLNTRLDDRDALLNDLKNAVNSMPGEIKGTLEEVANTVGTPISDRMADTWGKAAENIEEWNRTHAQDQQITRDAVVAGANSWGTFGTSLNDKQEIIKGDLSTATINSTIGIHSIENDIGATGGESLAKKTTADKNELKGDIDDLGGENSPINTNFTTANETLNDIKEYVKAIKEEADKKLNSFYMGDVDFDESVTSNDSMLILRNGLKLEDFSDNQLELADLNEDGVIDANDALMAMRMGVGLEEIKKSKSFSTGGLADYTGIANIHGTKNKPELVLNATDTQNFIKLKDILRELMKTQNLNLLGSTYDIAAPTLQLANMPSFISGMGKSNITQDVQIINNIEIDHVQDYNDFVNKLRTDPKFEKLLKSVNANQLGYGNSVDKYKYRW